MALKDEIKRERQAVAKYGTPEDKWNYFKDYYMVRTIAVIAVLVFAICFIYDTVTKPDIVLNGIFLNTFNFDERADSAAELEEEFTKHLKLTPEFEVAFSSNLTLTGNAAQDYQSSQAMSVQIAAGQLDFVVSPLNIILDYGYGGMLAGLNEVLTPEQMETYKPYFLYMDMAVYDARNEAADNGQDVKDVAIPDPTKPDTMEKPVPVLIDVSKCDKLASIYAYDFGTLAIGLSSTAPNPENICKFVDYLFQ